MYLQARYQVVVDLLGVQVLVLAADHAAAVFGVAQLAFVAELELGGRLWCCQPVGHGLLRQVLRRERHQCQAGDGFAQVFQQLFRRLGRGGIHHYPAFLGGDIGVLQARAAEGLRAHFQQHFVFQVLPLLAAHVAGLLLGDGQGLLLHHLIDHCCRNHLLLLLGADHQVTIGAVHQFAAVTA